MAQSLNGKIAIVTGASSGIGRAVAYELARHGAKLLLSARSEDRLAALAEDLDTEVIVVRADMTSPKDIRSIIERALSELGRIDILLANAGIQAFKPILEWEDADWHDQIDVNLTGTCNTLRAVAFDLKTFFTVIVICTRFPTRACVGIRLLTNRSGAAAMLLARRGSSISVTLPLFSTW